MVDQYDYTTAFSRNIGWVTPYEQTILRSRRVAIAGLGGVGGSHLLTLSRLGIGAFTIADFDTFELANFNRQAGSGVSTIGLSKSKILAERAIDINPRLDLRILTQGVNSGNMKEFLQDADLYVDSLDFFAIDIRREVFAACTELGIPAITVAPLGMGAALLNFLPGHMTFEEYFQLDGYPEDEQLLRFLLGLSPAVLQGSYIAEPAAIDFASHKGPSTPMACELCAGIAGTEALKILLKRGGVIHAPHGLHFDAYRNKLVHTWRPGGNRNPLQRLILKVARKRLSPDNSFSPSQQPFTSTEKSPLLRILDLARWAPSGDNTQPWRFEIVDDSNLVIHGHDTRDWCVYDLKGHASQLAIGALLENIAIAASGENLRARFSRQESSPETHPVISVSLVKETGILRDPLLDFIPLRSTQRRPLSTRTLTDSEKRKLGQAVAPGYKIVWMEGAQARRRMARLLFSNAHIRLTIPEAYNVHRKIIQWHTRFSEDRIPDQALGIADPLTLKLMRWAMQSWPRIVFLNRFLAGTWMPRLQLDVLPALRCAAHFVLVANELPDNTDAYLSAGRALQRFWLTATNQGLLLQPEMTPLIFAGYAREGITFTRKKRALTRSQQLARNLDALIGENESRHAIFMGRLGSGKQPVTRSTRLPLERLIKG